MKNLICIFTFVFIAISTYGAIGYIIGNRRKWLLGRNYNSQND